MHSIFQDVRYALRQLRKSPGFSLVAAVTLALGSGVTTVIFTVVSGVLLKPLAYPEPERLVTLHSVNERYGNRWGFSYPDFLDYKNGCRSCEGIAAWTYGGGTVSAPGEPGYVDGRKISAGLFSVLRVQMARGRAFLPEEDHVGSAPVAIISTRLWQARYGADPKAIGKPITYDGKAYTVVGIAPPGFQLEDEADVLTPLGQSDDPRLTNRAASFLHVVARLRSDTTLREAQAELAVMSQRLAKQYPEANTGITRVPYPLKSELVQDVRPTLWLLLGGVTLILMIACVNVASLLLTRLVSRQHEFALRTALGAPNRRLLGQCLTESSVLGICGGLLGLLLATVGTRPFIRLWPDRLPRADEVHVDWRVFLFAIGSSILTGLIFGLMPALRAKKVGIEEILRSQSRSIAGSARRPLNGFVMCQIALALVLLSAAGILGRTLLRLSSLSPGIDIRNVVTARIAFSPTSLRNPAEARVAWQELKESLRKVPGVESVALTDIVPMRVGENVLSYWATATPPPPNQEPEALASAVTPDYLKMMRLPLVRGRFFDENDRLGNPQVVVIDENMARHSFGTEDPVGKVLWVPAFGDKPVQVVGVVGHVRHWGLAGDELSRVQNQCYYPLAQVPDRLVRIFSSFLSIAIRTNVPPQNIVETLERQARGASGDQSLYEVRTMEQLASGSLAQQRFLLFLFAIFSALALLLACVGIYSVLAYLMSQRIPEIGVRLALGANSSDIMKLVLGESLGIILAGIAIGLLSSLATVRVLERLVPNVHTVPGSIFAVIVPVLITVALLASYIPARRAAKVDPMVALRYE
jgi:predicted permease